jgi:hypothetical protein
MPTFRVVDPEDATVLFVTNTAWRALRQAWILSDERQRILLVQGPSGETEVGPAQ